MTAIDAAGETVQPQEDAPTTVEPRFGDVLSLTKGSTSTGVVTFAVPLGDTIKELRFAPGQGDSTNIGTWKVTG